MYHMIEKIWWWGMITTWLKSPTDLHISRLKIKTWADMEATYTTLLFHVTYNIASWLTLRDDHAVLISLITKKSILSNYEGYHICYFTSKIYWIPTAFNGRNILMKWFSCDHLIVTLKQPWRICSLGCQLENLEYLEVIFL